MEVKGHAAKRILEDQTSTDVLDLIESTLTDEWKITKDPTSREEIWFTLQGCQRFREILHIAVTNMEYEATLKENQDA